MDRYGTETSINYFETCIQLSSSEPNLVLNHESLEFYNCVNNGFTFTIRLVMHTHPELVVAAGVAAREELMETGFL